MGRVTKTRTGHFRDKSTVRGRTSTWRSQQVGLPGLASCKTMSDPMTVERALLLDAMPGDNSKCINLASYHIVMTKEEDRRIPGKPSLRHPTTIHAAIRRSESVPNALFGKPAPDRSKERCCVLSNRSTRTSTPVIRPVFPIRRGDIILFAGHWRRRAYRACVV